MGKRSKILLSIVTVIACVTLCFLPIIASASPVSDSGYFVNPYCPTLYASYYTSSGEYAARQSGGYAQDFRFLVNSRSTFLLTTRYLETGQRNSILNDGYYSTNFNSSDYIGTDSIIYGASSIYNANDGYLFMPFYRIYDFGLSTYVSEGTNSNWNAQTILSASELHEKFAQMHFIVQYYNDSGYSNYYEEHVWMSDSEFYAQYDFESMRSYLLKNDDNFKEDCYFYSIGITYNIDYNPPSGTRVYSNTLIAIGDAEDYIAEGQYAKGVYGFGYNTGFDDASEFNETGVWGMISSSVGGFLSFEVYGGFTIGQILMICISVPLFVWVVKLLAGG